MGAEDYLEELETIYLQLQELYAAIETNKSSLLIEDVQKILEKCLAVERTSQAIRNTITPTVTV